MRSSALAIEKGILQWIIEKITATQLVEQRIREHALSAVERRAIRHPGHGHGPS